MHMYIVSLFRYRLVRILLLFLLLFIWAVIYAHHIKSWSLPQRDIGKDLTISGYVASLPQTAGDHVKFTFAWNDTKLALSWYRNYPILKAGEKWQFVVRLKPPHGFMNPGGFDYEKYLFQHGIRATGYVKQGKLLAAGGYKYPVTQLRQYLAGKIKQALPNNQFTGLLEALTIGSRNDLAPAQWQVFRNTGTSHLVAISGLHIGLVAGFMYFLVLFLWRRVELLSLKFPAQKSAAIGALFGAFTYSLMAGFALPTQRALIMISVFMLAVLSDRNLRPWYGIFMALILVLLLDPLAPLSAGFWLSFSAVSILIYSFSGRSGASGFWYKWIQPQLVVSIGLMPVLLLFFQQVSPLFIGANLVAIPWIGFVVVPLALSGCVMLLISNNIGAWLLWLASKAISLIWPYLQWLSTRSEFLWHHAVPNLWLLIAAVIGVLLLLAPRGFRGRWLGVIWLLPLLIWRPIGPKPGEVWLTLLDVGQGLATIVRTQHHVMIYDTGPKYSATFDTGAAVVVPYLRQQGVNNVDLMVISHGDNDHIGGAQAVLQNLHVKSILTSVPQRFPAGDAKYCEAGQSWKWDGVIFKVLSPPSQYNNLEGNNASCVVQIQDGKNSILLTGDIQALAEKGLVHKYHDKLHAAILVAPHHGSNTSSTKAFVSAVFPQYILFPTGFLNKFKFPSKKVLVRYEQIHAEAFNTAQSGAITFKFNSSKTVRIPQEYRKLHHNYWNN